MRTQTVRQSLLIYALVVSLALGFAITTLASSLILNQSRVAQNQAARRELQALVHRLPKNQIKARVDQWNQGFYDELEVVTATSTGYSLTWKQVQQTFQKQTQYSDSSVVLVRIPTPKESYLLARLRPQHALAHVQDTMRLLLIVSLIAAMVAGLLLGFLNNRIVLRPLASLKDLAAQEETKDFALAHDQTPNEIAQVALSFRRTVRRLEQEQTELEEKHRQLHTAQDAMSRASKLASLGRVAAGVAHEIGNPLAAIKGYLSLLKRGLDPKEQEDVVQRCVTELDRIHDTIRQLLTYARKKEAAAELMPFEVTDSILDILTLIRSHPALCDIDLQFAPSSKAQVIGHPDSFRQVVLNLVLNAGQALAHTEKPSITISIEQNKSAILVHVNDNGPGISKAVRQQIFDPFFTTKAPGEGTGLGLAVSRSLIDGMNGKLICQPNLDEGAQFTLELRADPQSPSE
jgi:two-component system, NtrC family, sensor kinase